VKGLDFILLGIVAVAGVGGFLRGLSQEVVSLAAWILAAFAVHYLHTPFTAALADFTRQEFASSLLAFCLLLLVPYAAMKLIATNVSAPPADPLLGPVDRVLGFGFGAIKGVLVGVFAFAILILGYDDTWGYQGRPTWIVLARSYPAADTFSRELVPMLAQRRVRDQAAAEAREKAAAKAAAGQ
jgi:membrane protein required for colicin V production